MLEEFDAQVVNHTWDLVPSPPRTINVIGCKWVYRTKFIFDGLLACLKLVLLPRDIIKKRELITLKH